MHNLISEQDEVNLSEESPTSKQGKRYVKS